MHRRAFTTLLLAAPLAACATQSPGAAAASSPIAVRMNYEGAEALMAALERPSITDAEIDRLLAIRGVQAMVDNTTKYIPASTREAFRAAMKELVATRTTAHRFGLVSALSRLDDARKAIAGLRAEGPGLLDEVTAPLNRYRPETGPLEVTVYSVIGGASDGFVLDDDPEPAFFMALDRSQGDVAGVKLNMTPELYHVAQRAARARVPGLGARVFDAATAPPPVRMLSIVLEEGTANYVADPTRVAASGPYFDSWRDRFVQNAAPERVAQNFALFDKLHAQLSSGAMTWDQMYAEGFSGEGPLYFVGYQMAKALDAAAGPQSIAGAFSRHPAAFFQDYVALARRTPALPRFSASTEAWLLSLPRV